MKTINAMRQELDALEEQAGELKKAISTREEWVRKFDDVYVIDNDKVYDLLNADPHFKLKKCIKSLLNCGNVEVRPILAKSHYLWLVTVGEREILLDEDETFGGDANIVDRLLAWKESLV